MDRIADALVEQRGEQGLIDWINGIDHTVKENDMLSYKTHAIRQSVEKIARNDREKAIQFIADNAQEPFVDSDTLERTSRYVSRTSIADEVQWLADLPEGIKVKLFFLISSLILIVPYNCSPFLSAVKFLPSKTVNKFELNLPMPTIVSKNFVSSLMGDVA